jgi:hypothetical protein
LFTWTFVSVKNFFSTSQKFFLANALHVVSENQSRSLSVPGLAVCSRACLLIAEIHYLQSKLMTPAAHFVQFSALFELPESRPMQISDFL